MKTGKTGRAILALIMAMVMVLSATATVGAEDYKGTIIVYNNKIYPEDTPMEKNEEGVWTMTGDIEAPDGTYSRGLYVLSEDEWEYDEETEESTKTADAVPSLVFVDGDAKGASTLYEATGVRLETYDKGAVDATLTGEASSETIVESDEYISAASFGLQADIHRYTHEDEKSTITAEVGSASAKAAAIATGENEASNAYAAAVDANVFNGSMTLTVNDGLTADSIASGLGNSGYADSNAIGLSAQVSGELEAAIDGGVKATAAADSEISTSADAFGIEMDTGDYDNSTQVKLTVNDGIAAYAEATGSGEELYATAHGMEAYLQGGTNTLTVNGGITAEANAQGTVTEDVDVWASGVYLNLTGKSDNTLAITGDVETTVTVSEQSEDVSVTINATGLSFTVEDDSKLDAAIEGDVSAVIDGEQGKAVGMKLLASDTRFLGKAGCGTISVTLTGDMSAAGGESSTGIVVDAIVVPSELAFAKSDISDKQADEPDAASIQYEKNVEMDGKTYRVCCTVEEENGEKVKKFYWNYYYVDPETGRMVDEYYLISNVEEAFENKAAVSVNVVEGDVTAETVGVDVKGNEASDIDLFINGTVDGGKTAVLLSEEAVIGENVTLTVWKLENEDDKLVTRAKTGGDNGPLMTAGGEEQEAVTTYENISDEEYGKIQYIIRIEAGQEDYIATDAGKQVNGYDVANENQKVTLKLTPPEGYEITGAFNGEGDEKIELTKDDEGNYYVTVERGGGVYLSVTYQ